jgi:putative glutamine transport system substrate-binding protein
MRFCKRWLVLCLSVVLAFSLTACGSGSSADGSSLAAIKKRGKLIAGVKYDTNLFGYKDPADGQVKGFEIDLMREFAKRVLGDEKKVEFKEVTSKTRIKMLQSGDVDLVAATMTITDKRKKQVDFSRVYFMAGQSLLVPIHSSITGLKSLNGKVVATAKGATSGRNLQKLVPGVKIKEYENYADAFTALKSGQADAVTTDDSILMGMQQQDPTHFKLVGGQFTQEPYGIAVKKGNKDLLKAVNDFLNEIMKDGTYQKLYRKWFKKDPPAHIPAEAVQKSP